MRMLGLSLLLLLVTILAAQPALTFPPPKVTPLDKETQAAVAAHTEKLTAALDRLGKLGARDPALADIEVYLEAGAARRPAQRILPRHRQGAGAGPRTGSAAGQPAGAARRRGTPPPARPSPGPIARASTARCSRMPSPIRTTTAKTAASATGSTWCCTAATPG